jgi:hypothetical protein
MKAIKINQGLNISRIIRALLIASDRLKRGRDACLGQGGPIVRNVVKGL